MEWIFENWAVLLLALITFVDVIVSLTPSKKDDAVLGYIRLIVNAITGANRAKKKGLK